MEVDEGMAAGPKRVASAMDEDEDGGSGSGSSALETVPAAAPTPAKKKKNASVFDEDVLRIYYKHVFPHEAMFRWLSYGNDPDKADEQPKIDKDFFARREFSFTIANDVYIRYLCFRDAADMRKLIEAKNPHKIDIGPLYTFPPKKHKMVKAADFKPVERELVFDIDLTDYDEVRLGCTPDQMWERGSWQYMAVAMKVVDAAIREDFGYKHLLWVFSGRRGVHCWVCDPAARKLEDKERKAIVDYLTVIVGNEHSASRVNLTNPLHPVRQALLFVCMDGACYFPPVLSSLLTPPFHAPSHSRCSAPCHTWNKCSSRFACPSKARTCCRRRRGGSRCCSTCRARS